MENLLEEEGLRICAKIFQGLSSHWAFLYCLQSKSQKNMITIEYGQALLRQGNFERAAVILSNTDTLSVEEVALQYYAFNQITPLNEFLVNRLKGLLFEQVLIPVIRGLIFRIYRKRPSSSL